VTIDSSAVAGSRAVTVTTNNTYSDTVIQSSAFTVNTPSFTSVTPASGNREATLTGVAIVGTGTHFGGTTTVEFGSNITVSNINVTNATNLTCDIAIQSGAVLGVRNVVVTTGGETVTGTSVFTVNAAPSSGSGQLIYEKAGGIMMSYPNPFNPLDKANPLKMLFGAATGEAVDIYILDTNGRVIYQSRDTSLAADRTVLWDGETSYGEVVENGIYLIRAVKDGKLVAKGKILVIKK
jgi:PPE-repeat protein